MVPVIGPDGGVLLVQLQITVLDLNTSVNPNPPTANTDIATTLQNTPVTLNTLANDACGNLNCALNPASVTILDSTNNGTVTVDPTNGQTTYTPNPGFTGTDTLYYQVCDNLTPTPLCATAMQIITVAPTGSANLTSAADDFETTPQNVPVSNNAMINDVDPENNTQTITPQTTTIPNVGTLELTSTGTYTFTPVSTFTGPVDFPYTTCDNGSPQACTQATIHILVYPDLSVPVIMSYFTLSGSACDALLNWGTSQEQNTSHFNILRKGLKDNAFEIVGQVAAAGNSDDARHYSFVNVNAGNGIYQYQIQTVDIDGKTQVTDFQSLTINCESGNIVVYPNPAVDYLNISINSQEISTYQIKLTDMSGRVIGNTETLVDKGEKTIRFSTSHIASGIYNLSVSNEFEHKTFSVRIVR